jgi:phosphoesterase RecJ-like protein
MHPLHQSHLLHLTTRPILMTAEPIAAIRDAILQRQRFVITSHARPDGDAIGSQVAMALALRELGKDVQMVAADAAPPQFLEFPGVRNIHITQEVAGPFDAAIVMECGDLSRTGVSGLDKYFVVNIDHHPGNKSYGAINWFDPAAAACGEMVFDLIEALGVTLTSPIATHIYITILTDTGGFHFSHITPRTFEICRRCNEAGAQPDRSPARCGQQHDGALRLMGAVPTTQFEGGGRAALATRARTSPAHRGHAETRGLINIRSR